MDSTLLCRCSYFPLMNRIGGGRRWKRQARYGSLNWTCGRFYGRARPDVISAFAARFTFSRNRMYSGISLPSPL